MTGVLKGMGRAIRPAAAGAALILAGSAPAVRSDRQAPAADWLIDPLPFKARVVEDAPGEVSLDNGLVRRTLRLAPNAATVAFDNLMTGESLLRSVRPEAIVELDGEKRPVGGVSGQPVHNYLDPSWIANLVADPASFRLEGWRAGRTAERFPWKKRSEWMPRDLPWPPPGVSLTLAFRAPAQPVSVGVHYEMYDGLPLLAKWITVSNGTGRAVRLNSFVSEVLAVVEPESIVDDTPRWEPSGLYVETDYTFGGMSPANHGAAVHWGPDPLYGSQVNYNRKTPCLLECRPPRGPDQSIGVGGTFASFRTFELALDSTERERRGLAVRRMFRALAPWVTENPVLMHVRRADEAAVKLAIDQCADVGFEMVIMTFGSGFDFESRDPAYRRQVAALAAYGRGKGVALGGYSLLASRGAATAADNTQGVPARFGVMPCLGAEWGRDYLRQLRGFMEEAGLAVLEHDGSYPGDLCAATNHPGHRGLDDSQWVMWRAITDFYQGCRARGIYLNIPDWYFLNGGSKTGMGYREDNWSLPREYQEIIERQNVYDGTWEKTPSMGWMFVPLTEYHGGGPAATIEPLKDHLAHYEARLANLFGAGVIACYRGPRLYDAPETRAVVRRWVDFYRRHREVLNADLIHLRRADGRDWDGWLHVNPAGKERGLAMIYNPRAEAIVRDIRLPLYYTGLTGQAAIRVEEGPPAVHELSRDHRVALRLTIPALGRISVLVEAP